MRILILVHNLTGGGAERVASLWASGFVQSGYKVGLVLSCDSSVNTYSIPKEIEIYYLTYPYLIGKLIHKLRRRFGIEPFTTIRLKKFIINFKPDVIIGVLQPWAECARRATKGMSIPIINTEHNSFERPSTAPLSKIEFVRKYKWDKEYDYVTVLTEADRLCANGINPKISVMPNPLAFSPLSVIPHKEKIILAAGRLGAWHYKGFDVLLRAWGNIASLYPDWTLQIAGTGNGKSSAFLSNLAADCGIERQTLFLGYCDDILSLYRKASIFVLSSRYEAFGMVLIEAMSQGCAPIACDYKGRQSEIITKELEGILCEPDNVNSLGTAIQYMIENEDYRKMVQQQAVERSKYFSLDNTMERWREIFNKIGLQ